MRHLRTWAIAVAAIGAVLLGGSKQASADILVTVSAGTSTSTFDLGPTNNGSFSTPTFNIDGYTGSIDTVVSNYAGTPSLASLSTTDNIQSTSGTPSTLTTTVVISTGSSGSALTAPLAPWNQPNTPTVTVGASASFTANATTSSGSVTTTTYYNSPPATTFSSSTGVTSGSQLTPTSGSTVGTIVEGNTGTYTLSQQIVLSGLNAGAAGFNFGGTSTVQPIAVPSVPEPSTMALATMGALGLIGYGLRRRKAARA
jgi:hypothetical protein